MFQKTRQHKYEDNPLKDTKQEENEEEKGITIDEWLHPGLEKKKKDSLSEAKEAKAVDPVLVNTQSWVASEELRKALFDADKVERAWSQTPGRQRWPLEPARLQAVDRLDQARGALLRLYRGDRGVLNSIEEEHMKEIQEKAQKKAHKAATIRALRDTFEVGMRVSWVSNSGEKKLGTIIVKKAGGVKVKDEKGNERIFSFRTRAGSRFGLEPVNTNTFNPYDADTEDNVSYKKKSSSKKGGKKKQSKKKKK